jgi:radical SAM superfamily enzyme YgiQ (UPF0313 family)
MDITQNSKKILKNISICFINPPILDYALYDLFATPLGTLKAINLLKFFGVDYFYLDALNKDFDSSYFESGAIKPTIRSNGTGKYWKKRVEPPIQLNFYEREFYRFGLSFEKIIEILKIEVSQRKKNFDFIVIPSVFTYHYLSIKILIQYIKENFKDTKIIIAGIYPKIILSHAKSLGADYVFNKDALDFVKFIFEITSKDKTALNYLDLLKESNIIFKNSENNNSLDILPDWDLLSNQRYGIIRLTSGCPYNCPYCASNIISGEFKRLNLSYSLTQLNYFAKKNTFNIAFYDDALLIDQNLFLSFLNEADKISSKFVFYLPNAIHIAKATKEILTVMHNFKMIRFGLESLNIEDEKYGNKFKIDQLKNLLNNLNECRIPKEVISFYILVGLPEQSFEEVENTVKTALKLGIKPRIAEYSPIPSTPLFEKAKEELINNKKNYINIDEPLFQNPSIYPYIATDFNEENMKKLKKMIYG